MNGTEKFMKYVYWLRRENVFKYMDELKSTEKLSVEELQDYKNSKLSELMTFVRENNEYYADKFGKMSRKMYPGDGIELLPIMDKKSIKMNLDNLLCQGVHIKWRSTSGTTGSPFIFPKDNMATGYMDAMMYNAYSWHGIKMGDKQARLWGRSVKQRDKLLQTAKDVLLRRARLSAFDMSRDNCMKYYNKLIRFKPEYFYAYSNALFQFANFVEENHLDGRALGIDSAICTGEVLFDYQRQKISDVFACRVINEYGSTENGIIGMECEFGKMHILPTIHLEIVNPDKNGIGEVLVTELNSRSIPFVRYKIGDKGKLVSDSCRCGRPYELFEIHEGRIDAYIRCPDGRMVYDAILAYTLKEFALQFKAYQERIDCLTIHIVPNNSYDQGNEDRLRKLLKKYVGDDMVINIDLVKEVPSEASGKLRYFVPLKGQGDARN